jgi:hypothetical protein
MKTKPEALKLAALHFAGAISWVNELDSFTPSEELIDKSYQKILKFTIENSELVDQYGGTTTQFGHSLALSMAGTGCGFCDDMSTTEENRKALHDVVVQEELCVYVIADIVYPDLWRQ